jgi:glutamate dehydrogenase (NAD(P)+)
MLRTEAGRSDPAIVTGKPVLLGGSLFRRSSTGVGVAHVANRAWDHLGHRIADGQVAIEGFGAVGFWAAHELHERGARIVGLSDNSGTITNDHGLDPVAVRERTTKGGDLVDYPEADAIDRSVLTVDCDIAVPAALEGTLTEDVANELTAAWRSCRT